MAPNAGASAAVAVKVAADVGFHAAVSLESGTLPAGLSASFSPRVLAAPGAGSATLTIGAAVSLAAGNYKLPGAPFRALRYIGFDAIHFPT